MAAVSGLLLLTWLPVIAGCGSSGPGPTVRDFLPKSGAIPGWQEDTSQGESPLKVFTDQQAARAYFNDALDPFLEAGWVAAALDSYVNGERSVLLILHQMESQEAAIEVFTRLQDDPAGTAWQGLELEDRGRISNQGTYWLIHARRDRFFFEASCEPGDAQTRPEAVSFANAVAAGLP
jgi:hypothetical protein